MNSLAWEPFDPTWLAQLAREQYPSVPGLIAAIERIDHCAKRSVAMWYFVDPSNANKPGAEWQFGANVHLNGGPLGPLVLDMLRDGRVGGVEFLARLGEVR